MADRGLRLTAPAQLAPVMRRRRFLAGLGGAAALALPARDAHAFGEDGAFNPRILLVGDAKFTGTRASAPSRWADEVVRRTSAPGRLRPTLVHADDKDLLAEPFVVWGGARDVPPLTSREVAGLKQFFGMGGVLFVDDFDPDAGFFGKAARREIARALPELAPIAIGPDNVVFRSFYLLKRANGRVLGPPTLDGIIRGGAVQVLFSSHDVLGALARDPDGSGSVDVTPGGEPQREQAVRLAVNVALYVLCSNYKDDQVHAEHIMRRRGVAK